MNTIVKSAIMLHAYWKFQNSVLEENSEESEADWSPQEPEMELPNGESIVLSEREPKEIIEKIEDHGYEVTVSPKEATELTAELEKRLEASLNEE